MKKLLLALTATVAFAGVAHATTIGVTMDKAGFELEHSSYDGPFGEWVGYYRRRK